MRIRSYLILIWLFCSIPLALSTQRMDSTEEPPSIDNHTRTQTVSGSARDATPRRLSVNKIDFVGSPDSSAAREPMVVEHPDGTLFVSGYRSPDRLPPQTVPRLWKSIDHGKTWNMVNVGPEASGAMGNSDVDLAVAPDGTLYLATMIFDLKTLEGVQISVGASQDVGKTWRWATLSKKRLDDRPWVAVAPDGTAHVVWNDGAGVYYSFSRDRGVKWSDPKRIHPGGGSSHLAVGPHGEIAVRITPLSASGNKYEEGVDLIAVSQDGGSTWEDRKVPGMRDWAPMGVPGTIPRWVEPLAWDASGALYLLWTDIKGVRLARSVDQGVRWKTWMIAESEALSYYPYLTVQASGQLAATWFSGAGANLHWQVCRIQVTDDKPSVSLSPLLGTDSWNPSDAHENAPVRDTAGEYLATLFLHDGSLVMVSPIYNPAAKRFGFSFWTATNSR